MKPILLVDDDDFILEILAKSITKIGFSVMKATGVSEAKRILQQKEPLLICADLEMPDGSGFELLDYVKENTPQIPFIVMSSYEKEYFCNAAADKGAIFSISKSEASQLTETIMEFANQSLPAEERLFNHRILYLCSDIHRGILLQKELLKQKYHVILERSSLRGLEKILDDIKIEVIL